MVAPQHEATGSALGSNGPKRMRIAAWNIENLAPWLAEGHLPLTAVCARLGAPDVLCLQEVRIRPQDDALIQRMRDALPGYRCHWSLNRDARNGTFRGGRTYGVATYVRERYEHALKTGGQMNPDEGEKTPRPAKEGKEPKETKEQRQQEKAGR